MKKVKTHSFRLDNDLHEKMQYTFNFARNKCGKQFTDAQIHRALWIAFFKHKPSRDKVMSIVCKILKDQL